MKCGIILFVSFVVVSADVFFQEEFKDSDWENRWIQSTHDSSKLGKFSWTAGKFYNNEDEDKGIQTSEDARFYALSAKFEKPFSNKDQPLVIQFQVKHEQKIDCGGGYVKVYPGDFDQKDLHGETPYYIMFGPDICGYSTKKVHVIFNYKGENHLISKTINAMEDELTHLYTLIVKPDNTYEVLIDNEKKESGSLEDDWSMLPPKKIKDPNAKKPEDWVDEAMIDDPESVKPDDWDDQPEHIADPEAKKPEDWDDEIDGEWEPPMIDNPEFKGEWKPKQIKNPDYKGPWVHPEIDNPDYAPNDSLYQYDNIGGIGIDVWQVKSGTIFDNFLVTNDVDFAKDYAKKTFEALRSGEKAMKEKLDAEEKSKEAAEDAKDEDNEDDAADEDDTIDDEEPIKDEL